MFSRLHLDVRFIHLAELYQSLAVFFDSLQMLRVSALGYSHYLFAFNRENDCVVIQKSVIK